MAPLPYRVVSRHRETADTVTLALEPSPEGIGPVRPGQFDMLWAFGVGEVPISLSGTGPRGHLVHTVRDVGAVSHALASMRRGSTVGVRGPFGTSWDVESAEGGDLVVVAGGIGLAPLRPVILHALHHRDRFGSVAILVGAREPDLLLFRKELHAWRSRFDVHVGVTVDHADRTWLGRVGVVPHLVHGAAFDPARTVAMTCGPEVMMRFTAEALLERGVPAERIRVSMERNMKCAIAQCGHCQVGPAFVCREGPVFTYDRARPLMEVREL